MGPTQKEEGKRIHLKGGKMNSMVDLVSPSVVSDNVIMLSKL